MEGIFVSNNKKGVNYNRDLAMMFKYMIGNHVEKIAKEHEVSTSTLYKVLKSNNIPLKTEREAREYFKKKIFFALSKEKKTVVEISKELGLPTELVNGYVRFEYDQMAHKKALEDKKKKKVDSSLGKAGLIGNLPSSHDTGLKVSQTLEEKRKRELFDKNEDKVRLTNDNLSEIFEDDFSDVEKTKLVVLRELLRHASTVTDIPDYSDDPLLLPDYLLPIDIVIMKDITARTVEGQTSVSIANVHRTDEQLVVDLVESGVSRDEFRDRFIKSLIKKGLIQL
jgi:hypothetical protein